MENEKDSDLDSLVVERVCVWCQRSFIPGSRGPVGLTCGLRRCVVGLSEARKFERANAEAYSEAVRVGKESLRVWKLELERSSETGVK